MIILGLIFAVAVLCLGFFLRWCFPATQNFFRFGAGHSYSILLVWILSSFIIIGSGTYLVHWFYVKYHIFERVQKTGSIVLPIAIDTVFVLIAVVLIMLLTVFFGRWIEQSSGSSGNVSLHAEVPTSQSSENSWPPPPRR